MYLLRLLSHAVLITECKVQIFILLFIIKQAAQADLAKLVVSLTTIKFQFSVNTKTVNNLKLQNLRINENWRYGFFIIRVTRKCFPK